MSSQGIITGLTRIRVFAVTSQKSFSELDCLMISNVSQLRCSLGTPGWFRGETGKTQMMVQFLSERRSVLRNADMAVAAAEPSGDG